MGTSSQNFGFWILDFGLESQERRLNKMQNFILSLASLSFIRRAIEGEVSQGHKKLNVI
jgi:hypothetical protein